MIAVQFDDACSLTCERVRFRHRHRMLCMPIRLAICSKIAELLIACQRGCAEAALGVHHHSHGRFGVDKIGAEQAHHIQTAPHALCLNRRQRECNSAGRVRAPFQVPKLTAAIDPGC